MYHRYMSIERVREVRYKLWVARFKNYYFKFRSTSYVLVVVELVGLDLGKRLWGGHVRHHASSASPWISCMDSRPSFSSSLTSLRVWASRGIGPCPRTSRWRRTLFRLTQYNLQFEPYHQGDWLCIHLFEKKDAIFI